MSERTAGFYQGYYCAVAVLLVEEGGVTTQVRSLFSQGGDIEKIWKFADACDLEVFVEHGLLSPK